MSNLRPYWFRSYVPKARLVTNPLGDWEGEDDVLLEKGWATLAGGWLMAPAMFRVHFPKACLFSRLEFGYDNKVKMWLYNPSVRAFFKTTSDRELLACWVDSSCIYEMPLV